MRPGRRWRRSALCKGHSQGEYIFDHGWAQAYERAGGRYYPKLQIAVPFTPATGRRFLGDAAHRESLLKAAISVTTGNRLSSLHVTSARGPRPRRWPASMALCTGSRSSFTWKTTATARSTIPCPIVERKRKMIAKSGTPPRGCGLAIRALTGEEIEPAHWEAFWQFYQDTGRANGAPPYLTRAAFDRLHDTMRQDCCWCWPSTAAVRWRGR